VLQAKNADGSERFRRRLLGALGRHEEEHYAIVQAHIARHIEPFC
jgi:predicted secreted Zn-dependent protease